MGQMENNVSPKHSSLAFDEVKEHESENLQHVSFEPELSLLVNKRSVMLGGSSTPFVAIGGRVTVSF